MARQHSAKPVDVIMPHSRNKDPDSDREHDAIGIET